MLSTWLNHARVRRQAILLGTCLWLVYAANISTPGAIDRFGHLKGADFLHPYVLGSLANEHRPAALYDAAAQIEQGTKLVPQSRDVWFVPVYPPQYALLFAPLARLPYLWAFALWSISTLVIYLAGCYALARSNAFLRFTRMPSVSHSCAQRNGGAFHSARSEEFLSSPQSRVGALNPSTLMILTLAYPGFVTLVMFGQNSIIAFAAFTLMYLALRSRRAFLAGLALGLLAYKPQLALVAALVFLFTVQWKVMLGAVISVAAQLAAVIGYFGSGVLKDYWHAVTHLGQYASILEPKPYLMHSLRAFWTILFPWPKIALGLYLITGLIAVLLAIRTWHRLGPTPLSFAVLLIATVLVTPHLTVYDLVILAPAMLFAGDWLLSNPDYPLVARLGPLLYFAYWIALLGPSARFTHIQLSVPIFAALLVTVSSIRQIASSTAPELAFQWHDDQVARSPD